MTVSPLLFDEHLHTFSVTASHSSAFAVDVRHQAGCISHRKDLHSLCITKEKRKLPSLRCSFLSFRHAPVSLSEPVSVYRSAQRRLAQQRMLMRHMHMGISMDIAVRLCFIARSPFLRKLQKAYHGLPCLSTPSNVLMMFFTHPAPVFRILRQRFCKIFRPPCQAPTKRLQ